MADAIYTTLNAFTSTKSYEVAPKTIVWPSRATYVWVANRDFWNRISADHQATIRRNHRPAAGLLWGAGLAAWGPEGHRVVGIIAGNYLCAAARDGLDQDLSGESLGEAGLWADRIRGDREWDHAAPWHYMNVPDGRDVTHDRV